ncbi:hypothetical protein [Clostridium brassicae]|uniref:Uncharacterized protein n=1 Tax=Clostridium brassicae TaxID=2999072 RepID=A0ABT4D6N2_9CLOT|nr:hypothetical protein [Clostridium brassicae]MCY6957947.1 hypothetical protein [Clostridium brassicae]
MRVIAWYGLVTTILSALIGLLGMFVEESVKSRVKSFWFMLSNGILIYFFFNFLFRM